MQVLIVESNYFDKYKMTSFQFETIMSSDDLPRIKI